MNLLEILFIACFTASFITWVWFIFLGFRANKIWGFSIVFLSPVAPFMFASRFARKARRAIYYYIITLFVFVSLTVYIYFFTIDFYTNFLEKIKSEEVVIEKLEYEIITSVEEIRPKENLAPNLEKKVPIVEETVGIKPRPKPELDKKPKRRSYKEVNINMIHLYINKNIIATTSRTKHKGKLLSVDSSVLMIKKRSAGGSVTMPIKKIKIIKTEVYL
jgi:hypothetical protein